MSPNKITLPHLIWISTRKTYPKIPKTTTFRSTTHLKNSSTPSPPNHSPKISTKTSNSEGSKKILSLLP
jgi:hypothetical protein